MTRAAAPLTGGGRRSIGGEWGRSPGSKVRKRPWRCDSRGGSHVEVQRELHRRRAAADRGDFLVVLVLDPGLDDVLGEDVALEQELVVAAEALERLIERAGHLRDVLQ